MKKLLIILACSTFFWSCKKEKDKVSTEVKVSFPTVTFAGESITGYRNADGSSIEDFYLSNIGSNQTVFVRYPVGSTVNIIPTAYDSVLKQSVSVQIVRNGNLDVTKPGLYIYDLKTGTNSSGYGVHVRYFIGITNVNNFDLEGMYQGAIDSDPSNSEVNVSALAPGMYFVDDPVTDLSQIGAVFVQTGDTTLSFGESQPTDLGAQSFGEIEGRDGKVKISGGDTVLSYRLINGEINSNYPATTIFSLTK